MESDFYENTDELLAEQRRQFAIATAVQILGENSTVDDLIKGARAIEEYVQTGTNTLDNK